MKVCDPLTLKASSLKTRARLCRFAQQRTCSLGLSKSRRSFWLAGRKAMVTSTLTGSPCMLMGHPIGLHVSCSRHGGTTHPRLLRGDAFRVLSPKMS